MQAEVFMWLDRETLTHLLGALNFLKDVECMCDLEKDGQLCGRCHARQALKKLAPEVQKEG
jgi:hypothetical protein